MSRAIVINKLPAFGRVAKDVLNDALREGASDILVKAKTKSPFKKGQLRSNTEVNEMVRLMWRVSFWQEYARFQEFGGDSKRRVRKYSTSGTGKGYLKSSGDEVANRIVLTFKKHGLRARI